MAFSADFCRTYTRSAAFVVFSALARSLSFTKVSNSAPTTSRSGTESMPARSETTK